MAASALLSSARPIASSSATTGPTCQRAVAVAAQGVAGERAIGALGDAGKPRRERASKVRPGSARARSRCAAGRRPQMR